MPMAGPLLDPRSVPGSDNAAEPLGAEPRVLLHVGCGRAPLPQGLGGEGWREIRYDIDPSVKPDLVGSLTAMDQVAAGSVEAIWSSHNLQHLVDHEVPQALAEFWRVLRPGGVAWIVVPDVQCLAERIASGDLDGEFYRSPAGPITASDVLWGHRASLAEGRTFMAHRTGFTAPTLERRLLAAGFGPVNVERRQGALELFATAVRPRPPEGFDPQFEEGRRRHAEGAWAEAETLYRQVLERLPGDWRVRLELAMVCHLQGRNDEAIGQLRQVVAQEPRLARAQRALGTFLAVSGRQEEALAPLQRAVDLEPSAAEGHYNLGNCCAQLKLPTRAERAYREAIRLDPRNGLAQMNLAQICNEQFRGQEGVELCREALRTLSEPALHSNLPMLMNFLATVDDEKVFEAHRAFDRRFVEPLAARSPAPRRRPPADGRLRVGYLSRDLRRHSVRYFLLPILAHHDHSAFEISCYFDGESADDVTELFRSHADRWIATHGLSDEALAGRIRQDGIDLLIDLGGHTANNRLLVFARRPAPLQITYLGYPSTTGASTIDHRISDRWIDPEPPEPTIPSSEKPLRLRHGYFCYAPIPDSPPVSDLPFDRSGTITFGCLNQGMKLNETLFARWAEILRALPGSRLWLQNAAMPEPQVRRRLAAGFEALGVDPARLVAHGFDRAPAYLHSYHQIDIALDTFPYNGGTTTCEALWMGVPVVSWKGGRHVARLGASILNHVGLGDLVADSGEDYVALALALAADVDRLRSLRAALRERMGASPLMDHAGFTRELEAAFQSAWADHGDLATA
jgi:predicted O-linked N-acetylglucosamine transferase (SPINDLY family)/SAM-dependent methyltransferase